MLSPNTLQKESLDKMKKVRDDADNFRDEVDVRKKREDQTTKDLYQEVVGQLEMLRAWFAPFLVPSPTYVVTDRGKNQRMEIWAATEVGQVVDLAHFIQLEASKKFTELEKEHSFNLTAIDSSRLLIPLALLKVQDHKIDFLLSRTNQALPILQFSSPKSRLQTSRFCLSSWTETTGHRTEYGFGIEQDEFFLEFGIPSSPKYTEFKKKEAATVSTNRQTTSLKQKNKDQACFDLLFFYYQEFKKMNRQVPHNFKFAEGVGLSECDYVNKGFESLFKDLIKKYLSLV